MKAYTVDVLISGTFLVYASNKKEVDKLLEHGEIIVTSPLSLTTGKMFHDKEMQILDIRG
jgi:hypothetical protein